MSKKRPVPSARIALGLLDMINIGNLRPKVFLLEERKFYANFMTTRSLTREEFFDHTDDFIEDAIKFIEKHGGGTDMFLLAQAMGTKDGC